MLVIIGACILLLLTIIIPGLLLRLISQRNVAGHNHRVAQTLTQHYKHHYPYWTVVELYERMTIVFVSVASSYVSHLFHSWMLFTIILIILAVQQFKAYHLDRENACKTIFYCCTLGLASIAVIKYSQCENNPLCKINNIPAFGGYTPWTYIFVITPICVFGIRTIRGTYVEVKNFIAKKAGKSADVEKNSKHHERRAEGKEKEVVRGVGPPLNSSEMDD